MQAPNMYVILTIDLRGSTLYRPGDISSIPGAFFGLSLSISLAISSGVTHSCLVEPICLEHFLSVSLELQVVWIFLLPSTTSSLCPFLEPALSGSRQSIPACLLTLLLIRLKAVLSSDFLVRCSPCLSSFRDWIPDFNREIDLIWWLFVTCFRSSWYC